ncbi:hypothetical protein ACFLS1_07380 [Verrucomicrobiota bacterium]
MKTTIIIILIMICGICFGNEVIKDIAWQDLKKSGDLNTGEVVDNTLKLENTTDQPMTFNLLTINAPGITAPAYSLKGRIKYDNVKGNGYLEMRNHFPGGKAFFSKTLAPSGPMGVIQGSSGWRDFNIPFMVRDETGWLPDRPEKLQFNLLLSGKGTVHISNIQLTQTAADKETPGSWWSRKVGIKFGAYGGVSAYGGLRPDPDFY